MILIAFSEVKNFIRRLPAANALVPYGSLVKRQHSRGCRQLRFYLILALAAAAPHSLYKMSLIQRVLHFVHIGAYVYT